MQRHQIVTGVSIAIGTFITYQMYSKSNKEQYELPGPIPSDKVMGNFSDMNEAGSMPEYLLELSKKYGNIGAFWWGDTRVAYITSQKVLLDTENKKKLNKLSARPQILFDAFKPLISQYSIQYANGREFQSKYHKVFLMAFQKNMSSKLPIIIDLTQQIIKKWNDTNTTINMSDDSFDFASKSIFHICFGSKVVDKNTISEFIDAYKMAWGEMEKRLIDGIPSDAQRDAEFEANLKKMKDIIRSCLKQKDDVPKDSFLHYLLLEKDVYDTEMKILADAITAAVGGFHTTGTALSWIFYYISMNEKVQQQMFDEIKHFFKVNSPMSEYSNSPQIVLDKLKKMTYCKQVITESLRLSSLAPWGARVNNEESMILNCCNDDDIKSKKDKVMIPKRMPFIIGFGAALNEENMFKNASKFDPDRWSRSNLKKDPMIKQSQNAMFGGLGGRVCPGMSLAKTEILIFMVAAVSKFKFEFAGKAKVGTKYGLVGSPTQAIRLKLTKRVKT